jgi:hypothetical protein
MHCIKIQKIGKYRDLMQLAGIPFGEVVHRSGETRSFLYTPVFPRSDLYIKHISPLIGIELTNMVISECHCTACPSIYGF